MCQSQVAIFRGILIFSSADIDKYEPDVDTQFLERIGSVVSTILDHVSHREIAG